MARTRKTILIDEKIAKGKVERAKARYILNFQKKVTLN